MSFARRWTAVLILTAAPVLSEEPIRILTYPTGLVVGELGVRVDLGPAGRPAELYLDGEKACSMSAAETACTVELGADPHVHLLELVRDDGARAERWVNRPGQEAELSLQPLPPSGSGVCQARIGWAHPEHKSPVELEVILPGAQAQIGDGGHSVSYPCPPDGESQTLVAMAVFPDGRRVESTAVVGGFVEETSVEMFAVPLVAGPETPCEAGGPWPEAAERLEKSGFEAVIVLDPDARYLPLRNSGWNTGQLANTSGASTKAFDQVVRSGSQDSAPEPRNSWLKAKSTFFDADRLWYVAPDEGLSRVNGFAAGKPNWLDLLFKFGLAEVPGKPRIADAVAASGLVAAAGPRRRAVVLVLGNNVHKRDGSRFTPQQAREYLAEVGVPLLVLRNGKRRDDGWPEGLSALNMDVMSKSLRTVREVLDAQCIGWFASRRQPSQLEQMLPEGVRLAGRGADAPTSPESVWARAEVEMAVDEPLPQGLAAERLDITAVTVVVSAVDAEGRPVADLTAEDVEVTEDGSAVSLLGLAPVRTAAVEPPAEPMAVPGVEPGAEPAAPPAEAKDLPVAIYVNRTVGGGFDQRQALNAVAGELERLAALGPVEVVVAEKEQVKTLAGPTRDLPAVRAALEDLAGEKTGQHAIERIRRRFVTDIRSMPDRVTPIEAESQAVENDYQPSVASSRITLAARAAAGEEHVIISRALEQLTFWARRETGQRAGLLVLVGAGFDEDPLSFYSPWIEKREPHNLSQLREDLRSRQKQTSVNALGRELASTGWRILAVAGQTTGSSSSGAEMRSDRGMSFLANSADAVHTVTADFLLVDPIDSQRHLAAPSGGDVVVGPAGLGQALDQSTGWYQLTYQVDRPPDGETHAVALTTARPGVELKTTKVVTAATSEGQAEARVRRLLGGAMEEGELGIDLAVGPPAAGSGGELSGEVEATVHFGPLAPLMRPGTGLRVSMAVVAGGAEPSVEHRREQLTAPEGGGHDGTAGWIYTFPVAWPPGPGARLAVTVEALASGAWGGRVVDLPALRVAGQ